MECVENMCMLIENEQKWAPTSVQLFTKIHKLQYNFVIGGFLASTVSVTARIGNVTE